MNYRSCIKMIMCMPIFMSLLIHAHGFSADTLVRSGDQTGWWAIEQVAKLISKRKKQKVLSYDVNTYCWVNNNVESAAISETNCYCKIGFDKHRCRDIFCTPTQEFYLAQNNKWISAYALKIGDVLLGEYGRHVPVSYIKFVKKPLKIYSIQIQNSHTFLVSELSVLTHNMMIPVALTASLSIPLSTSCSSAVGAIFGPVGFAGGLAVGGLIGYVINSCTKDKITKYQLTYDVTKIGKQFEINESEASKTESDKKTGNQEKDAKQKDKKPTKTADDVIAESKPGKKTKGKVKQFEKPGGFEEALDDFDNLAPSGVREISAGKLGRLPDGRMVNVRNESTDSRPTLEIKNGKKGSIKIRYGDKVKGK